MSPRPHDVEDLYLAPVALGVDAALAELAGLSRAQLDELVAIRTNQDASTPAQRRELMLEAVTHLIDLRRWRASWDGRGLALEHEGHRVVLGVPASVREYLDR